MTETVLLYVQTTPGPIDTAKFTPGFSLEGFKKLCASADPQTLMENAVKIDVALEKAGLTEQRIYLKQFLSDFSPEDKRTNKLD